MDGITLGQVAAALAFLVGIITAIGYLKANVTKWIADGLQDRFDRVDRNIDDLKKRISDVDLANCKNFLVTALRDIENGTADEIEKERFFEQYEHYRKAGGNSYIKNKVEKLEKEGKI